MKRAAVTVAVLVVGVLVGLLAGRWVWDRGSGREAADEEALAVVVADELETVCRGDDPSCRVGQVTRRSTGVWEVEFNFSDGVDTCWVVHLDAYRPAANGSEKLPSGIAQIYC